MVAYQTSMKHRNEKDVITLMKKQKSIATMLLIALGVSVFGASPALADDTAAAQQPQSQITTSVNGSGAEHIQKHTMSNAVINEQGTLYLPLRSALEQMGATVTTNPDNQARKIKLTIEGQNYQLFYNANKTAVSLTENGTKHTFKNVNGTGYVPMAFIQEMTNRVVSVSGSTLVLFQTEENAFWKTLDTYTVDPNYVQQPIRERLVTAAKKYIGVPYVWGGTTPAGFDCSGFVQYVYKECGMSIPRVTYTQQAACTPVALSNLQPGDLVFWGASAYHVGIYLGNGQYIHAPAPGQSVKIQSYYEYAYTSGGSIVK